MENLSTNARLRQYLKVGVWQIHERQQPRPKALLIRTLRVLLLALRGFRDDRCPLRASALTFYSLLSIVPVAALLFGIAKGLGYHHMLEVRVLERFAEHEAIVSRIMEFSQSMLESAKGGVVAGIGVVVLLWTVIRVLGNIEQSFNDIWSIRRGRSLLRKFTDYLAIVLIVPINFVLSGSATIMFTTQVSDLGARLGLTGLSGSIISFTLQVLPWLSAWILLSLIYVVMPNTRVRWSAGLIAGLIAGLAFQATQIMFVEFQLGVLKYNAIYGGFAVLPLFLVWMQASWLIVLLGAEISFAIQNVDSYEFAALLEELSSSRRRQIAIYVAHAGVSSFAQGEGPLTASEISHRLGIPIVIVRDAISDLVDAGLFLQILADDRKETAYQPATDIKRYTIYFVLERLNHAGSEELPAAETAQLDAISEAFREFEKQIKASPANKLLLDLGREKIEN